VDRLQVSVTTAGWRGKPYTVVSLAGETDLTTVDRLREALTSPVQQGARLLVADLSGLGFMDSAGVRTVLQAVRAAREWGGRLALASPQPVVARVLLLMDVAELVPVYASVAAAARGMIGGDAAAGDTAAGEPHEV
jgi:anti-sigma B factor antagonist